MKIDNGCPFQYRLYVNNQHSKNICSQKQIISNSTEQIDIQCGRGVRTKMALIMDPRLIHPTTWQDQKAIASFLGQNVAPICIEDGKAKITIKKITP
jgi:hypothetical protein